MPRHVDPQQRLREIANASLKILARGGSQALTLKSLAEELGGSITLVTHFVSTRDDLFSTVVADLLQTYDDQVAELEAGAGPEERLCIFLEYMIPSESEDIEAEAGRLALIPRRGDHAAVDHFFEVVETRMRDMFAQHLRDLVAPEDLDNAVSYLRATVNGLVVSAVEHRDRWGRREQLEVVRLALKALDIDVKLTADGTALARQSA